MPVYNEAPTLLPVSGLSLLAMARFP